MLYSQGMCLIISDLSASMSTLMNPNDFQYCGFLLLLGDDVDIWDAQL